MGDRINSTKVDATANPELQVNPKTAWPYRSMSGSLDHLIAGIRWCLQGLWKWPVVLPVAMLAYGLGVNAMYGRQPIIAAVLYFAAIAYLTIRLIGEARSQDKTAGITIIVILVGGSVFALSLKWIQTIPPLHETNDASPLTWFIGRLKPLVVFFLGFPWHIIAPSVLGGALMGGLAAWKVTVLRDRKRQSITCPDAQLHELKANDKNQIRNLVRIAGISYHPEFWHGLAIY
jgi:hypothetical protein